MSAALTETIEHAAASVGMQSGSQALTATLRIEGELTIYQAMQIKTRLLAALDAETAIELDLGAVTDIDTAGMQLLLAFAQVAAGKDLPVLITACSPVVAEVAAVLGVLLPGQNCVASRMICSQAEGRP